MFTYQKFQYDKNVSSPQMILQVNYSSNQNPNGTLPITFEKSIVKPTMKRHGPTTAKTLTTRKNKRGNVLLQLEGFLSNQDNEGLVVLVQGKSRAQKEIHVLYAETGLIHSKHGRSNWVCVPHILHKIKSRWIIDLNVPINLLRRQCGLAGKFRRAMRQDQCSHKNIKNR